MPRAALPISSAGRLSLGLLALDLVRPGGPGGAPLQRRDRDGGDGKVGEMPRLISLQGSGATAVAVPG